MNTQTFIPDDLRCRFDIDTEDYQKPKKDIGRSTIMTATETS